jgi:putative FmdB family regulatory protein
MPRYTYACTDCDFLGDIVHSYKEHPGNCPQCDQDMLCRDLSKKVLLNNQNIKKQQKSKKAGSLVKSEIKNSAEELKRQKEELKNREKE